MLARNRVDLVHFLRERLDLVGRHVERLIPAGFVIIVEDDVVDFFGLHGGLPRVRVGQHDLLRGRQRACS
jgi:hypothetical protein